ncbi:hypothetical protein CK203_039689 [Vitis vinifera]|uniref:Disease resistance protein At4g27190-like leucine-rich repeats domain-containing protein n=1 Tax=Vitis vinifera TaxID=29760 RepID=A0A438HTT9_VITVI|nr:hypothetical protein CK203_039689 [Vitis vinifera]
MASPTSTWVLLQFANPKSLLCPCLLNLIPSHLIQRFDNLKEMDVDNCEALKHVFDLQGLDENIRILPRLESLWLWTLPKLRRVVCNEDEDRMIA